MEDGAVRLGLRMVGGLAAAAGERIVASRPHASVVELARRAGLNRKDLKCLAAAGALQSLAGHRRSAHWAASGVEKGTVFLPSETGTRDPIEFEPPGEGEEIVADYQSLGFTLGRHPLALLRIYLEKLKIVKAENLSALRHGSFVRAAGLVTCRQRPDTASGVVFVTLEDESGCVNVVVWRDLLERQRRELLGARLLAVEGVIQREGQVVHLLARRLEDHSPLLKHLQGEAPGTLRVRCRDFH
jgi:error-prone DNA polymerase